MNKDTRNHCKFCRFLKCKATGMMNKWVVSAYKIKDARNKNSLTTSSKKDEKRSNDQENDLSRVENCSKMITYKYDIDSTPTLIEEMNTKYCWGFNSADLGMRKRNHLFDLYCQYQYKSIDQ